jgi:hypothetical protein
MLKKIILLISLTGCLMNLAACSPYVSWKEEVKLNDGRVIVVEQKKLNQGGIAREAWLTINLPEFSAQPIIWNENLDPLVVNIDDGKLYVVGHPPTPVETRHYGCPQPPYVGFVWENGTWIRIPFEKIPEQIYTANMLSDSFPPKETSLLTLEKKDSPELGRRPTLPALLKRLDPKLGNGC